MLKISISLTKSYRYSSTIRTRFFSRMETSNIPPTITSTIAGDDGEAVVKIQESVVQELAGSLLKPASLGWYVAVVRMNCEKRIASYIQDDLKQKGIWFESWVPVVKNVVLNKRTNKRKKVEKVFLSTFIFCHISPSKVNEIRFRSDVYKMLTMPGHREIYRIPDEEMDNYRAFVDRSCLPISTYTGPLKKGQKVRIIGGPMQGLEAYVQRTKKETVIIGCEIKYISGATIEVARNLIEVVG